MNQNQNKEDAKLGIIRFPLFAYYWKQSETELSHTVALNVPDPMFLVCDIDEQLSNENMNSEIIENSTNNNSLKNFSDEQTESAKEEAQNEIQNGVQNETQNNEVTSDQINQAILPKIENSKAQSEELESQFSSFQDVIQENESYTVFHDFNSGSSEDGNAREDLNEIEVLESTSVKENTKDMRKKAKSGSKKKGEQALSKANDKKSKLRIKAKSNEKQTKTKAKTSVVHQSPKVVQEDSEQNFCNWLISLDASTSGAKKLKPIKESRKPAKKPKSKSTEVDPAIRESAILGKAVASETLAQVLYSQGHKEEAIEMLEKLLAQNPEKSSTFAALIEKIKKS
ncbi:MAG TPA: tetratricopeptide repeat protein [Saprospiraceae bacterium]|nr:tetratricopeptide repeat protein [Saprospiraceae bacterium]